MAGGAMGGGDDDGLITDINVTPLVDVVLVLLIILMVTATQIVSKTINVELPSAQRPDQAQAATPTTLAISIDEEGQLYLDREEVDEAALRTRVRAARAADDETRAVIAAHRAIAHGTVIRIIDLLRQENVNKFAFNVRQADLED